jgi:hypothetical protein
LFSFPAGLCLVDSANARRHDEPDAPPEAPDGGKRGISILDLLDSFRTKEEHTFHRRKDPRKSFEDFAMAESAPPVSNDHYEQACDQAIMMCGGNMRGAIKALIMANEYLETELQEFQALVSGGLTRTGSPRAKGNAA